MAGQNNRGGTLEGKGGLVRPRITTNTRGKQISPLAPGVKKKKKERNMSPERFLWFISISADVGGHFSPHIFIHTEYKL